MPVSIIITAAKAGHYCLVQIAPLPTPWLGVFGKARRPLAARGDNRVPPRRAPSPSAADVPGGTEHSPRNIITRVNGGTRMGESHVSWDPPVSGGGENGHHHVDDGSVGSTMMVKKQLYLLVAAFLKKSGQSAAAQELVQSIESQALLPTTFNWRGEPQNVSYEEYVSP